VNPAGVAAVLDRYAAARTFGSVAPYATVTLSSHPTTSAATPRVGTVHLLVLGCAVSGLINEPGRSGPAPFRRTFKIRGPGVSGRMSIIMENMAKKRARPRRSFTPQFKAEIVELCQRGDRTLRQVSLDFDLTETAVREWVKQADLDTGARTDGLTSAERDELAQLRRENRRLREDVDILKRATAFFAKETR
jgi:transposase